MRCADEIKQKFTNIFKKKKKSSITITDDVCSTGVYGKCYRLGHFEVGT